jgi:hypothetical protein
MNVDHRILCCRLPVRDNPCADRDPIDVTTVKDLAGDAVPGDDLQSASSLSPVIRH